ncbi:MAG: RdgB/HAM1 family non-canonical purine NTP pyrophosphatase [Vicinamibacteria bacterium]|jgi:XTP/dITP diphosphohydrolase|nr:RdgB/HAM1 family non-canonical purine NTP pyrophosphatase [Vicinamibacteria bacterium]
MGAMEAIELLLASQNRGKLGEMRALLGGLPYCVLSPGDFGIADAPDETGRTFLENASIKARAYARRSGLLSVADDSGLSVDALLGGPGLFSSRFGGDGANDDDRNRLLLRCLGGVPNERRGARFTSALVVAQAEALLFSVVETVEGRISDAPRGANGFGYDPLFFYPPYGKTFGEISPEAKARVSHRGKAFARLRQFLMAYARARA